VRLLVLFFAAVGALIGCSVNPVTGESQLTLMSPSQEVAMGEKSYAPSQQSQGGRYTVDPDLTFYVSTVGKKLAAVSDRPNLPYEFVVLNNDTPNAWALPGGKIALNRGLLVQLKDEAQLAAVLSHEIVHAAAKHGATQMTQNMLLQLGVQAVGYATKDKPYGAYTATGAGLGASAWQARYGRGQELEADAYGMVYMSRAGYGLNAAVELQQTFVKLSQSRQSNWLEGMFASHPPSQERVNANRLKAQQLGTGGKGNRNQSSFQRAIKQLKKDGPAYKKHQDAIKAASQKQFSQALALTEQAIKKQPREGMFWETKGHIQERLNRNQAALTSFERAIANNPEYFGPYLARGLLEKKLGKAQLAEKDLLSAQNLLPTQTANYHLGELALARRDTAQARAYFQIAAQSGGELGQAAQQHLTALSQAESQRQPQKQ